MECEGRSLQPLTKETDHADVIVAEDHCIPLRFWISKLRVSLRGAHSIMQELDRSKYCARWVPYILTEKVPGTCADLQAVTADVQ